MVDFLKGYVDSQTSSITSKKFISNEVDVIEWFCYCVTHELIAIHNQAYDNDLFHQSHFINVRDVHCCNSQRSCQLCAEQNV